ncbi:MAG: DUF2391 family protein [Candidatus Aenigmarchaeota archaeon]|nr:DUF2391 family protein [Candidatus Aenigmarchaeota archaeon]NIP40119.1 DUF2391 family protein [Candidatus Aenigmarchaeota archaeon]NIQ18196.1 DUF2391 family protein [Candidatus Aenigmarchaeota archaeon]NIS72953.1 DUF2391 family protein [Candidatus Aenigmarchaeota archaeon]
MVIKRIRKNGTKITSLAQRIKPEKFEMDDVAQQIFGAVILATPLSVTEEVWTLARELEPMRLVMFILLSIAVVTIIIYYTKFQRVAKEAIAEFNTHIVGKTYIPKRLVSLFLISYSVTWFILWLFGVMNHVGDPAWSFRIFIFVSFFASVGAATADILR